MKYIIWDYNAIRGFARRDVKRGKFPDLITAEESYMVDKTPLNEDYL